MWLALALALFAGIGATNDVFPPDDDDVVGVGVDAETPAAHQQHLLRHTSSNHRVHNLVLNPEQHSLCELKHIRQIVTHAHCTSKEMENYVCMGTCFSYTVPQTEPETPGDELLDYCDSCQASESHWTTIQLDCEEYGQSYQVPKNIQMITNCSCSPCHPSRSEEAPLDNEVTYPSGGGGGGDDHHHHSHHHHHSGHHHHHVPDLLFKMLPRTHVFKEAGMLPLTEMSLGELKKKIDLDHPEKLLRGQVLFRQSAPFADADGEEDPKNLA